MVNRVNEWRGWQGKGMKERSIPVAHGPGATPRVSDLANSSSPATSSIPFDGKVRPKVRPKQAMDWFKRVQHLIGASHCLLTPGTNPVYWNCSSSE